MTSGIDDPFVTGLRVFVVVVETKSFTRAAAGLGMTQSGVSRAIARLEQRVGARLFFRTSRAISLSDEGRRLYASVAPLLERLELVTAEAVGGSASVRGTVRVNVDSAVGQFIVAPRLREFLRTYPEIGVELEVRDRLADFAAEGYDVAVRFGELDDSSLVCRRLLETRVLTCASPAYLEREGVPRQARDLEKHEQIHFRNPQTGRPFAWELRRERVVDGKHRVETYAVLARARLVVNDVATLLAACEAGCGIGQALECYVQPYLDAGRLVQVLPSWSDERFPVYLYHYGAELMPARVRAFIDFVIASVAVPRSAR
ncbi:MAG: LysR family transcriptional regulator [Gemmatimonadetes bacterium]|nr:LysR family transcriptional regulator [Gemmatimonadota bacterium]